MVSGLDADQLSWRRRQPPSIVEGEVRHWPVSMHTACPFGVRRVYRILVPEDSCLSCQDTETMFHIHRSLLIGCLDTYIQS